MVPFLLLHVPALAAPAPAEPPAPPAPREGDEALFRQARELRFAQRWYESAQAYRQLLERFPGSSRVPEARFWLANVLEMDQRWDEAAAAYTEFLTLHPEQRLLGREAKLDRIRCWGVRQWDNPRASQGLADALQDGEAEVRISAALQLSRRRDLRAVPVLQAGLRYERSMETCRIALEEMGVKPQPPAAPQGRFLVVRIREQGKKDAATIRVSLGLARAVGGYLSEEHMEQARRKGVDVQHILDQAMDLPKGSELFSLDDGKSRVSVTVE